MQNVILLKGLKGKISNGKKEITYLTADNKVVHEITEIKRK